MLHSFLSLIAHSYKPGVTILHAGGGRLRGCTTLRDRWQVGAVLRKKRDAKDGKRRKRKIPGKGDWRGMGL